MEEKFNQLTNLVSKDLLSWGGLALLVVLLFYVVKKVLALRARKPEPPPPLPSIDVLNLSEAGPPSGPPVLELYHLPVRLAAVLLAPVGRARELPPPQQIPEVLDAVIPGLGKVFVKHRPIVRIWPAQLSPRGFSHAFFAHALLPGDAGKGTPWCSVAGVFKYEGQAVVVGMVMRTDAPTSLGQTIVENETKWLDALRIRHKE